MVMLLILSLCVIHILVKAIEIEILHKLRPWSASKDDVVSNKLRITPVYTLENREAQKQSRIPRVDMIYFIWPDRCLLIRMQKEL